MMPRCPLPGRPVRAGLLLLAACGRPDAPPSTDRGPRDPDLAVVAADAPFVQVDTVRAGGVRAVATLPATVVVNEDATVRVQSPVVGRIERVLAEPGDRVAAGAPLARIVSSDLASAQADEAKAEAALAQLSAAYRRATELYAAKVIAQRDLEQARADEAQARAEAARAAQRVRQLGAAGGTTGTYLLIAPIGGVVVDRTANPGQEVRNDNGVVLFTISALDDVWVTAQAYEQDLARIAVGQDLAFTTEAYPDRAWTARVTYEGRALDPVTRTATVRAVVANRDGILRPQMFGTARLLAPLPTTAMVVPSPALVTSGDSILVFVREAPGRFRARRVTVGADDGHTAVVISGVTAGQLVATDGSLLLEALLPPLAAPRTGPGTPAAAAPPRR